MQSTEEIGSREGEAQQQHLRRKRTYFDQEGWWVRTREGAILGPFDTDFDAQVFAALMVAQLAQSTDAETCRRIIYAFRHDDRFPRRAPTLETEEVTVTAPPPPAARRGRILPRW